MAKKTAEQIQAEFDAFKAAALKENNELRNDYNRLLAEREAESEKEEFRQKILRGEAATQEEVDKFLKE